MYYNTYQQVLACIELVFGMYEIMIRANTDQYMPFISICPKMDPIHSQILSLYNKV